MAARQSDRGDGFRATSSADEPVPVRAQECPPGSAPTAPDSEAYARSVLVPIHVRLAEAYGLPVQDSLSDPTEELVRTILSQNTNDVNRDRALERLRWRFPTWHVVMHAPAAEVADAIAPGGLSQIKAPRIQRALQAIAAESADCDLSFICGMPIGEARAWLTALPGVGPKTAACVLLFSCGKPVMPVDTHILRVSRRVGLITPGADADAAHEALAAVVPGELVYPLHINLIRHGRSACRPQNPRCPTCVIADVCRYGQKSPPGAPVWD